MERATPIANTGSTASVYGCAKKNDIRGENNRFRPEDRKLGRLFL